MKSKFTPTKINLQGDTLNQVQNQTGTTRVNIFTRIGLKTVILMLFLISSASVVQAQITSTAAGGNWATGSTWVGGVVPTTSQAVIIATIGTNSVSIGATVTQTGAGSVTVNNGARLNITTIGADATFGALTVNVGGIVTVYRDFTVLGATNIAGSINFGSTSGSNRTMTFTGDVTLNSGAVWNETATGAVADFSFSGDFTNNATTFAAQNDASAVHIFTGTAKTFGGTTVTAIPYVTINGTRTNNGTLTVSAALAGSSTLTNSATGILNIGGTSAITGLTATAVGNLVNYTGAAQTCKVTTYDDLTLSGSGAKTFATTPTVNGVLSLEGTATVAVTTGVVTFGTAATLQYNKPAGFTASSEEWITPFVASGGVIIANTGTITINEAKVFNASVPLTINSGATLATNNLQLTLGGNFVKAGTLNAGSSPVVIANTMATQSIAGFTTTGLVSMTKTSGTATFVGNVIGAGFTLNGSGGTINLGIALTHTFTGNLTLTGGAINGGSSTLRLGGTSIGTGASFTAGTGTVEWFAAGPQTIPGGDYYNLILSGSGAKTLSDVTNVLSNFTMSGSATATLSASLTITGTSTLSGTSTLTLGAANLLSNTGGIILNGGTLSTGVTTGNSETVGVLTLAGNSAIALGTGSHTLTFAASNGETWAGTTLTINGWTGTAGSTGTAGKIFFGSATGTLTGVQLAKISFSGYTGTPVLLSTGEVVPGAGTGQTITTGTVSGSTFCAGIAVSVPFTISGVYTAGNVFTAQLSNSSGSFTPPVDIGTLTQTGAGTISGTIPVNTATGTGYRIRVVSSTPTVTGTDNGSNLIINALPNVSSIGGGALTVCIGTATPAFTDATGGGIWSILAGTGTASITAGGVATGLTAGTVTVTYTVTNGGCTNIATQALTVNAVPSVTSITGGASAVCIGSTTVAFADATLGGIWSITPGTGSAIIDAGGLVTGTNSGTALVTYTVSNGSCTNAATQEITVNDLPVVTSIIGNPDLEVNAKTTFTCATPDGSWTSSDITIATVNSSTGEVTGVGIGTAIIYYTVTNGSGCSKSTTQSVNVSPATGIEDVLSNTISTLAIYPNPFIGNPTIKYTLPSDGNVTLIIRNLTGQVLKTIVNEMEPSGEYSLNIETSDLQPGVYLVTLSFKNNGNEVIKTIRMVKGR